MSRADKKAIKDRQDAITDTAIETSNRVNAQLKENIPSALEAYNKSHPQQQIPVEHFTELTNILNGLVSAQNRFANTTNAMLSDMARATAVSLQDLAGDWKGYDQSEYMKTIDPSYGSGGTAEMRATAQRVWVEKKKRITERYLSDAKGLISQANEYQLEMLKRLLPSQRHMVQDTAAEAVYKKLLLGKDDCFPEDLSAAAYYLEDLRKKLP